MIVSEEAKVNESETRLKEVSDKLSTALT